MPWRLVRDLDRIRRELDRRLRSDLGSRWTPTWRAPGPPVNIFETPEEFVLTAEIPGADRDKFDLSFTSGNLLVRGEYRDFGVKGNLLRSERPTGTFHKVIQLSNQVDPNKLDAEYEHGVLTMRIAKSEEARPKRIEVKVK